MRGVFVRAMYRACRAVTDDAERQGRAGSATSASPP
jgi:hypothetical protein